MRLGRCEEGDIASVRVRRGEMSRGVRLGEYEEGDITSARVR